MNAHQIIDSISEALEFVKTNFGLVVSVLLIIVVLFIYFTGSDKATPTPPTPAEIEAQLKVEIEKLDSARTIQKTELSKTIEESTTCIKILDTEFATTKPLWKCSEKIVSKVIPEANAAEPPKATSESTDPLQITWLVNKEGKSKSRSELLGSTFDEISINFGIPVEYWYSAEKDFKIKKEVTLCIGWADSTLGKHLKSKNNIGNVGNNDRGDVVSFATQKKGVEAIFRVLNNKYLGEKQTIGSLSYGGGGEGKVYATSPENWDNNVRNCLGVIHGQQISKNFKIRL